MPVKAAIKEKEKEFLKKSYKSYYFKNTSKIRAPTDIEKREIAFLSFDGYFIRHMHFETENEFRVSIIKEVPWGVFYSVSKYEDPGATEMDKKGLIESDLVFDIDVKDLNPKCLQEHDFLICENNEIIPVKDANTSQYNKCIKIDWVCPRCLQAAKEEVFKLIDILTRDLGIAPSRINVYYSGHRGFHVHVEDKEFSKLNKEARSQIVEYITMNNFNVKTLLKFLPMDELGTKTLVGHLQRIVRNIEKELGVTLTLPRAKILEKQNRLNDLISRAIALAKARIDPQVTLDVSRVFRLPNSLNEKSGLAKYACKDIVACDPLQDSIVFEEEPVRIQVKYAPKINLAGYVFGPYKNARIKVPSYLAIFLISKGVASLI